MSTTRKPARKKNIKLLKTISHQELKSLVETNLDKLGITPKGKANIDVVYNGMRVQDIYLESDEDYENRIKKEEIIKIQKAEAKRVLAEKKIEAKKLKEYQARVAKEKAEIKLLKQLLEKHGLPEENT